MNFKKLVFVNAMAFSLVLSPVVRAEEKTAPAASPAAVEKAADAKEKEHKCEKDCECSKCKNEKKGKKKQCKHCDMKKHGEEHKAEHAEEKHEEKK